jgi:hypothetical protein
VTRGGRIPSGPGKRQRVHGRGRDYRAEEDLLQSERAVTTTLIVFKKALGGSWKEIKLSEAK